MRSPKTRRHPPLNRTYTVMTIDTLGGIWIPTTDLGNGAEQVTYRDTVPQGASARFIRVRAVKP